MTLRLPILSALRKNEDGAYAVEFALIMMPFLTMLVGIFDIGYAIYTKSIFEAAVMDAGRSTSLQSASDNQSSIEQLVRNRVNGANNQAQISFARTNADQFTDFDGAPEDFIDAMDSQNGVYDASKDCFYDLNNNKIRDNKAASSGIGSGNDVVKLTATLTYDSPYPLWKLLGKNSSQYKMEASTLLRNQPYADQEKAPLVCP